MHVFLPLALDALEPVHEGETDTDPVAVDTVVSVLLEYVASLKRHGIAIPTEVPTLLVCVLAKLRRYSELIQLFQYVRRPPRHNRHPPPNNDQQNPTKSINHPITTNDQRPTTNQPTNHAPPTRYKVIPDSVEVAESMLEASRAAGVRPRRHGARRSRSGMANATHALVLRQLGCDTLWRLGLPLRAVETLLEVGALHEALRLVVRVKGLPREHPAVAQVGESVVG